LGTCKVLSTDDPPPTRRLGTQKVLDEQFGLNTDKLWMRRK